MYSLFHVISKSSLKLFSGATVEHLGATVKPAKPASEQPTQPPTEGQPSDAMGLVAGPAAPAQCAAPRALPKRSRALPRSSRALPRCGGALPRRCRAFFKVQWRLAEAGLQNAIENYHKRINNISGGAKIKQIIFRDKTICCKWLLFTRRGHGGIL